MWESFRTSLRHDLLPEERRRSEEHGRVLPSMTIKNALYGDNAGVSVGSFRYAPESVWEIERCVLESDNHEAATRLVAAVTTSGPTGMVGAFDTSSVSDTSLPAAIAFCQRCESRSSASLGVIELRVVSVSKSKSDAGAM